MGDNEQESEKLESSEGSSDEYETEDEIEAAPGPNMNKQVNQFILEIKKKKEELGKAYSHNAFYNKHSKAVHFLNLKKNDPDARLFVEGSYAWAPHQRKMYEPAKVVESIEYSSKALENKIKAAKRRGGGQVNPRQLIKGANSTSVVDNNPENETVGKVIVQTDDNKLALRNVSAKAAKNLIPMQNIHLQPSDRLDVNVDDLSAAPIMHCVRYQFEKNESPCLLIGDKTLVYVNRFLAPVKEMEKDAMRAMERRQNEEKAPINVEKYASSVYDSLNASGGTEPQSCIITGNQRSNRRFVSESFTRRVVMLSKAKDADWYGRLQAADEILTVFGGENFLRWTELHMKYDDENSDQATQKGKLIGGAFQSFLLDTANITNKSAESFDIFRQLCEAAAVSTGMKRKSEKNTKSEGKKKRTLDFKNDLSDSFKIRPQADYFYLNKGTLPEYRFSPEEIEDYFEDPEEKRKREEAKQKAEEERIRAEKEAAEKALKDAKDAKRKKKELEIAAKKAREEELKKQREERKRKKQADREKPKVNIGKVDTNKFIANMDATNKARPRAKPNCAQDGCDLDAWGTEKLCQRHFFAQSRTQQTVIVAKGQPSTAVKETTSMSPAVTKTGKPNGVSKTDATSPAVEIEVAESDKEQVVKVEEDDEKESEPVEEEEEEPNPFNWERTLEKLKTLDVKDSEIESMVNVLSDILEIGNVLVCNIERTDGKFKQVEILNKASDDEKEMELIEKKIDIDEIYNTKPQKAKTMRPRASNAVDIDGKKLIKNVAVDFLVEKELVRKRMFGVDLMELVTVLNVRKLKFGTEEILKPLGRNKCLARRDALVRALYAGMFNWLLSVINRGVSFTAEAELNKKGSKKKVEKIGIIAILESVGLLTELDSLESNSLEQLINNYAQEKLHSFETIHILEQHAKIYQEEMISVPFSEGNELVLPLILGQSRGLEGEMKKNKPSKKDSRKSFQRTFASMNAKVRENPTGLPQNKFERNKKTLGILDICEEQFRAPKGSDKNLIERIRKEHKVHPKMLLSQNKYAFRIQHFGAKVNYNVKGFVKKAWSSVLDDEVKIFMVNNTEDRLVKKLLSQYSVAKQQKKLQKVYKQGMEQIRVGIAAEKLKENHLEGPLILSRHSVNVNNSRLKRSREDLPVNQAPSPKRPMKKNRMSVNRGLVGMTMTLNLAGLSRVRNSNAKGANDAAPGVAKVPSLQSMPVDGAGKSNTVSAVYGRGGNASGRRGNQKVNDAKANLSEGVQNVYNTMNTVLVMLDVTQPHFIHCVPSNAESEENYMEPMYVFEQLKNAGIIPFFGKRYKECSFGSGFDFDLFKRKHHPLNFIIKKENLNNPSQYMKNLQEIGAIEKPNWRVGAVKNRIYLKTGTLFDIQTLSETSFEDMVVFIQKYWRMGLTRKLYFELLAEKFIAQLDKANKENDLVTLTTVVGKCKWYKIATREMYIAEGKIKRLRVELKLRKKLAKATEKGQIGQIFAVLHEAKDKSLPFCEELRAAVDKYNILNAAAEAAAKDSRETLKNRMGGVMDELKDMQEFEKEFDVDELIADLRRQQMEAEGNTQKPEAEENNTTKLNNYFVGREKQDESKDEEKAKKKKYRNTVRFNNFESIVAGGAENEMDDDVDVDSVEDLDDTVASRRGRKAWGKIKASSVHSMASSVQSSNHGESWMEGDGKIAKKGGFSTSLEAFNNLVKGPFKGKNRHKSRRKSRRGIKSFWPSKAASPSGSRKKKFRFRNLFKFGKRKKRTESDMDDDSIIDVRMKGDKGRRHSSTELLDHEEDFDDDGSLIRVDDTAASDPGAGGVNVNTRGSFINTFRGSFTNLFKRH